MTKKIFVDGYNLAHKLGSKVTAEGLRDIRSKLEEKLSRYAARHRCKMVIVYDGKGVLDSNDRISTHIEIHFTPSGKTADEHLKRLIDKEISKSSLTLISSDLNVRQYAKVSGVKSVKSEEFLAELNLESNLITAANSNQKPAEQTKVKSELSPKEIKLLNDSFIKDKPSSLSEKEIDEWKRLFGE